MPKAPAQKKKTSAPAARKGSPHGRSGAGRTAAPDFAARRKALRAGLDEGGFDGLLILNAADIRYLTGFRGEDSALVVTARKLIVVSDFRFKEELDDLPEGCERLIRSGGLIQALGELLADLELESIALQAEHMTLAARRDLASKTGARRLKESRGLLRDLRIIKDAHEVELIRQAVRMQEKALLATLETIESGQTESQICARLEFEMKVAGGEKPAFDPIVAARANGSLPHAVPGRTKTKKGEPLLIDWGVRAAGYVSDMTRTFALGAWPGELGAIYEIVLEAQVAAIEAVRPGIQASEVDGAARRVISEAGYGECFGHSLGHGIGLDVHEAPRLAGTSDETLRPGMVITIEPGVYIPGLGGVRIEDDVLVTEVGVDNLSSLPKDIGWATR